MLEEGHLLLQFFREISQRVTGHHILPVCPFPLHVIEVATNSLTGKELLSFGIENDFGGIIEKDPRGSVGEQVSQPVFR